MTLHETILSDLSSAMKAQQKDTVAVLRLIKAALLTVSKSGGESSEQLDDATVIGVLKKEAKKRKEAAAAFRQGMREDLAAQEELELQIIQRYLPAEMSEDDIRSAVQSVIAEKGTDNFGAVMGAAMQKLNGQADGGRVKQIVTELMK